MSRINERLALAVASVGPKPSDTAGQAEKRNWNQRLSTALALAVSEELRLRGMVEARPTGQSEAGPSGAERRLAGGIGAKKVDVSWATEESGLIFAGSVKTIMFRDAGSNAFQKNLTNRRGDLLVEAVTLHRRFPYAVLAGFLFLDAQAASDHTARRRSTFDNAFPRLRLFTRRPDPSGREEQFERLYLILVNNDQSLPVIKAFEVNSPDEIELSDAFNELVELIGERNFDLYEGVDGNIRRV